MNISFHMLVLANRHFLNIFRTRNEAVQVDIPLSIQLLEAKKEIDALRKQNLLLQTEATIQGGSHHFEWLASTPERFLFYTGLTRGQFGTLFRFLEPDVYRMKMWKSEAKTTTHDLEFQLKLVLLRLRRGYNLTDISYQGRYLI